MVSLWCRVSLYRYHSHGASKTSLLVLRNNHAWSTATSVIFGLRLRKVAQIPYRCIYSSSYAEPLVRRIAYMRAGTVSRAFCAGTAAAEWRRSSVLSAGFSMCVACFGWDRNRRCCRFSLACLVFLDKINFLCVRGDEHLYLRCHQRLHSQFSTDETISYLNRCSLEKM